MSDPEKFITPHSDARMNDARCGMIEGQHKRKSEKTVRERRIRIRREKRKGLRKRKSKKKKDKKKKRERRNGDKSERRKASATHIRNNDLRAFSLYLLPRDDFSLR